eukprot:758914-Hanusia_phi.AAC.1
MTQVALSIAGKLEGERQKYLQVVFHVKVLLGHLDIRLAVKLLRPFRDPIACVIGQGQGQDLETETETGIRGTEGEMIPGRSMSAMCLFLTGVAEKGGAARSVSSEVNKPQDDGEEEEVKESNEKVEFNVTLPDEALKDDSGNIDVEDLGEAYAPYEEYPPYEEYSPYEYYYPYDPRRGMRSRGRPRGAYARGGYQNHEEWVQLLVVEVGVMCWKSIVSRLSLAGARGRGGTFAAKKWVNPSKEGQATKAEENSEAGEIAASAEQNAVNPSTSDANNQPAKVTRANAPVFNSTFPEHICHCSCSASSACHLFAVCCSQCYQQVIGVLNLDGDLSLVEKHGLYKAAKWVKPGLKTPEGKQQSS